MNPLFASEYRNSFNWLLFSGSAGLRIPLLIARANLNVPLELLQDNNN